MASSKDWNAGTKFPQYPTLEVAEKAYAAVLANRPPTMAQERASRTLYFKLSHIVNQAAWQQKGA